VQFDSVTLNASGTPTGQGKIALLFEVNGHRLRWPKTGTRPVRVGRTYMVKKSFTVDLTPEDTLSLSVMGAEPLGNDLPIMDNDVPMAVMGKSFTAAEKWGRGRHKDHSLGQVGAYTIYYTIKRGR
jgi:hypothetical protein